MNTMYLCMHVHTQVCQHPSASVKDNVLVVHEPRTQRNLSLCIGEIEILTPTRDPRPTITLGDRPVGGLG